MAAKEVKQRRCTLSLPIDAWIEILLRVPTEKLIELKGVCKSWHELITSRSFLQTHLTWCTSRSIGRLLINWSYWREGRFWNEIHQFRFDHLDDRRGGKAQSQKFLTKDCSFGLVDNLGNAYVMLAASCDGLVLISYAGRTGNQLLICNPVTRSHWRLPTFQPNGTAHSPSVRWAIICNGSIGRYKIFAIDAFWIKSNPCSARRCYILDLNGDSEGQPEKNWKELEAPLPPKWPIRASTTKGGKVHWLAIDHREAKVLSFDIWKEEFTTSASVELSLAWGYHYFASNGTFYGIQKWNGESLRLWTLEISDDLRLNKRINILHLTPWPVLSERVTHHEGTVSVTVFNGAVYVFDMISKEWCRIDLGLDFRFGHAYYMSYVPYVSSLVEWS